MIARMTYLKKRTTTTKKKNMKMKMMKASFTLVIIVIDNMAKQYAHNNWQKENNKSHETKAQQLCIQPNPYV